MKTICKDNSIEKFSYEGAEKRLLVGKTWFRWGALEHGCRRLRMMHSRP